MKIIRTALVIFVSSLLINCEVEFNNDLREYIDNIVARSPLNFSLSDSVEIDNNTALNMGYNISEKEVVYTITNNETIDIYLAAFDGITGDFFIDSYEAFTLESGESFEFAVTFNYSAENNNTRVSKDVNFFDTDGRAFSFYLWATSRIQPLSIYSEDDELLSVYDLGNFSDNRTHTLKVKNEGLQELQVSSITPPDNIIITTSTNFSMDINAEVELILEYTNDSREIYAEDLVIVSDYPYDIFGGKTISLYAGGSIPLTITDSSNLEVVSPLFVGTYSTGDDPIVKSYTITNDSEFSMNLSVNSNSSDSFSTTLITTIPLDQNDSYEFQVSFTPTEDYGSKSTNIYLNDDSSGRSYTLQLSGYYSI